MSFPVILAGGLVAVVVATLRALAIDEVRVRLARRTQAKLEVIISTLPPEVQETWGEDMRTELAAINAAPLLARAFVRGVRRSASQLAAATASAGESGPQRSEFPKQHEMGKLELSIVRAYERMTVLREATRARRHAASRFVVTATSLTTGFVEFRNLVGTMPLYESIAIFIFPASCLLKLARWWVVPWGRRWWLWRRHVGRQHERERRRRMRLQRERQRRHNW